MASTNIDTGFRIHTQTNTSDSVCILYMDSTNRSYYISRFGNTAMVASKLSGSDPIAHSWGETDSFIRVGTYIRAIFIYAASSNSLKIELYH
jgi:hypothetical protein